MQHPRYIQIDIPEPCGEDWNKMTPCEQGRHCAQCNRTVIDFTTWSDAALYDFFSKDRGHVCGRYLASQVGRAIHIPPQPHSKLYRMVVAMGLTLIFAQGGEVYAQSHPPVAQEAVAKKQKDIDPNAGMGEIKGTVTDDKRQPVIGAVVQVSMRGVLKGGAATDFDGNYVIKPLEPGLYTVEVQYAGMEKWTGGVAVSGDTVAVNISLVRTGHEFVNMFVGYKKPLIDHRELTNPAQDAMEVLPVPVERQVPQAATRQKIKGRKMPPVPARAVDTPQAWNIPGKRDFKKDEIKNMPIR